MKTREKLLFVGEGRQGEMAEGAETNSGSNLKRALKRE